MNLRNLRTEESRPQIWFLKVRSWKRQRRSICRGLFPGVASDAPSDVCGSYAALMDALAGDGGHALAPKPNKRVVVAIPRPRTWRYDPKVDELPVTNVQAGQS
jgi:hypothetical protein